MRFLKTHPRICNLILFLLCCLAAFAMRTHNYNREAEAVAAIIRDAKPVSQGFFGKFLPAAHKNFMPFTIESAMMFGYTQDIAAGKGVPASDPNLHGLEDIPPYSQMIMALEWFLGWGYRIKSLLFKDPAPTPREQRFQDNVYLAQWVAFQLRAWISLSSGFLFLLLLTLRCRRSLAFAGGLFHAVAIAAIARSTGQDIIRGNFALPLVTALLLLLCSGCVRPKKWKYLLLGLVAFGLFSSWDLSLGFFSAVAVFELIRCLIGGKVSNARRNCWTVIAAALVLSSLLIPFNRAYDLIMSPLIVVLLPSLLFTFFLIGKHPRLRFSRRLPAVLLPPCLLLIFWNCCVKTPRYVSHYSHFGDLTEAKLKFKNVKPRDPDLLTYDARIMWTPAMHSADWRILVTYFPSLGVLPGLKTPLKILNTAIAFLPFSLTLFCVLLLLAPFPPVIWGFVRRNSPRSLFFFAFTGVFAIGFIYIVRYHEFLIIFLALSLMLLCDDILRGIAFRSKRLAGRALLSAARCAVWTLLTVLLLLETLVSLAGRRRYSSDVHLRETALLIEWFRQSHVEGKCVIADFTVGPMLKCYAGSAIALQPQFGLERIRRPTQIFLNLLYHGTETQLARFCNDLNADFFLFNEGYLGPLHIYSERYIAAAKTIRGDSPVNLMKYHADKLSWFYRIEPPRRFLSVSSVYSVFRVIKPGDRMASMRLCFAGERALQDGERSRAARYARAAFLLDPASEQARILYFKVYGDIPKLGLNGLYTETSRRRIPRDA